MEAGVTILISNKIDFKMIKKKCYWILKEVYFILIKVSVHQEDINVCI